VKRCNARAPDDSISVVVGRHSILVHPLCYLFEKFLIERSMLVFADGFQPCALGWDEIKTVSHAGEFDV